MAALARMKDVRSPCSCEGGALMKKIQIRKAGPVRLTSSACSLYTNPN